jgi:phosphoglycolate phosphatase-like HAD superfamily hydrolase
VDLHAGSWVDSFARFGVQVTFEDVRRHIGEGADRLIPAFVPPGMPDDRRKQLEEFRSDLFKRDYLGKVKPFPTVRELFGRIKADRCKLVLASSCAADDAMRSQQIYRMREWLDLPHTRP